MSGRRPIWPNPSGNKFGRAQRAKILLILPQTEFFNSIGSEPALLGMTLHRRGWSHKGALAEGPHRGQSELSLQLFQRQPKGFLGQPELS